MPSSGIPGSCGSCVFSFLRMALWGAVGVPRGRGYMYGDIFTLSCGRSWCNIGKQLCPDLKREN